MSAVISHMNRKDLVAEQVEQAQLYLREFDPKRYSTFYARIYDADAYLSQVGIEMICELIEHGNNLLNVAKKLDISGRTLRQWINQSPYRRLQLKEAYQFAGDAFAFKAEETLLGSARGTKEQMSLAGKLADHYRWMASKLDKEQYGDSKKDEGVTRAPLILNMNFGGAPKEEVLVKQVEPLIASFMHLQEE